MLTASEGENSSALEDVLIQRLQARPTDVQLRVIYLLVTKDTLAYDDFTDTSGDLSPEDW